MRQDDSVQITIVPGFAGTVDGGRLIALDPSLFDFDAVIMQRPMMDWQIQAIALFQEAGVAVVVEIDDDFGALHKDNTASKTVTPIHRANLVKAAQASDMVTCTTEALARRYAPHGRVVVLPNYVPASYLDLDGRDREGDVVGWSGTVASHPRDLQSTHGGVASALDATGARFRVVGRSELVQRNLRLSTAPELAAWCPIVDYAGELAKLDVGIAPLARSRFNAAKSWLKMLECAAVGTPVIGSDIGEYRRLNDLGIGILASSRSDWHGSVTALLQDRHFRAEQSAMGRQAVRDGLLIEQHAWRWSESWAKAIYNRAHSRHVTVGT